MKEARVGVTVGDRVWQALPPSHITHQEQMQLLLGHLANVMLPDTQQTQTKRNLANKKKSDFSIMTCDLTVRAFAD